MGGHSMSSSARLPHRLALFGKGARAFAGILAAHQHAAFARVMLPKGRVGGDAAFIDAERDALRRLRSEEHTSELQSLMRISYAVFCLKKKNTPQHPKYTRT